MPSNYVKIHSRSTNPRVPRFNMTRIRWETRGIIPRLSRFLCVLLNSRFSAMVHHHPSPVRKYATALLPLKELFTGRVIARGSGRVRSFLAGRVESGHFSRVGSGEVISRGSGWVGSGRFSRAGSFLAGRVWSFIAGRVGSGHFARVGSGLVIYRWSGRVRAFPASRVGSFLAGRIGSGHSSRVGL